MLRIKGLREGKQTDIVKIKNHTYYELKEKYLTWMRGRHKSANSKEYGIEQMASHLGDLPLRRCSTMLVEPYRSDLTNKGLKPASENKNISILKAMFAKPWNGSL